MAYVKHPVHMVNQLDRPVSGLVIFALTEHAMRSLTDQLVNRKIRKGYLAVIPKGLAIKEQTLKDHLIHRKNLRKSFVGDQNDKNAKEAILHYQNLASSDNFDLLFVELLTGRFHQIRSQMSNLGYPIRGDVKYGFKRSNKDRSIDLHSWVVEFNHPTKGEKIQLFAPLPNRPIWNHFKSNMPEFSGWKTDLYGE